MFLASKKLQMPSASEALPGRSDRMAVPEKHFVLGTPLEPPFQGMELAMFGMGCFWGAERKLWQVPGVCSTMVGYAAGLTPNPTYREVCSGGTGHNEVVRVAFVENQSGMSDRILITIGEAIITVDSGLIGRDRMEAVRERLVRELKPEDWDAAAAA